MERTGSPLLLSRQSRLTIALTLSCRFNPLGFNWLQALRFAIEEINNSNDLLPGIQLGFEVWDTCQQFNRVITPTLHFLTVPLNDELQLKCNYTSLVPHALAVIGPSTSEEALTSATMLSYFMVPQVSYSASSSSLEDRTHFPSFFRTIPSDSQQTLALVELVERFHWDCISILASDSDYGKGSLAMLQELFRSRNVCISYSDIIPGVSQDREALLQQMVVKLDMFLVNVTIIFADISSAMALLSSVITWQTAGRNRVWIASEAWSSSNEIASLSNIHSIGTIMGLAIQTHVFPGFQEYLQSSKVIHTPAPTQLTNLSTASLESCQVSMADDTQIELLKMAIAEPEERISLNVYTAVYSVAHAIHNLHFPFLPQILEALKSVSFEVHNISVSFNSKGNLHAGYDLLLWKAIDGAIQFVPFGQYTANGSLRVDTEEIWAAQGLQIPESKCYEDCLPGQIYRMRFSAWSSCMFICEDCPEGTYQADLVTCRPCTLEKWSPARSMACLDRDAQYLSWEDPYVMVLVVIACLGLALTIAVLVLFAIRLDTPVVKAAGGRMSLLMLFSLACSSLSLSSFVGRPNDFHCKMRQPLFAISFTVCISSILVKSFQIICIFKMAAKLPMAYKYWMRYNGPYMCILGSTLMQATICLIWYSIKAPYLVNNYKISSNQVYLQCYEGSFVGFTLMLSYIGLLGVLCFIFAFMGRKLPKNYNEARFIVAGMLIYFISWFSFFLTYATSEGKYVAAVQIFAVLNSTYGILFTYFMPKCYIILLKPESNTTAYFQNCLRSHGVARHSSHPSSTEATQPKDTGDCT
uniref:Taste receptor type 1 member 1-like n=2 Tax=Erpetoichthys calabaricus TaxID=27687 RepID=A0A8C4RZ05_ERPCA